MSSGVIDVDAHIRESNNYIRAYLSEPYWRRGSPLLESDGMWAGDGTNSDHRENPDMATRLSDMDLEGINIAVLFPTNSLGMRGSSNQSMPSPTRALITIISPISANKTPALRASLCFRLLPLTRR